MSSNDSGKGESERFEAQRQAFSRLMARFTADRDATMAAVQQCNERIDDLFARLGSGDTPPLVNGHANGGAAHTLAPQALEQQQAALAEVKAASERAVQTADESIRRVFELAEQIAQSPAPTEGASHQDLGPIVERLSLLEERVLAQDVEDTPSTADQLAAAVGERIDGFEGRVHNLELALEGARRDVGRGAASRDENRSLVEAGLRDLRDQMSHLQSVASWTPKLQRLWVSLVASAVVAAFAVVYIR